VILKKEAAHQCNFTSEPTLNLQASNRNSNGGRVLSISDSLEKMRLIDVDTLELKLFSDSILESIPYAILSHTWADSELTFDHFKDGFSARNSPGYDKIFAACQKTKANNIKYLWADTCCIDKSSSAELSESINSMFRWYKNSTVCFAFLSDLPTEDQSVPLLERLRECKWWTRGWTLQELIAPTNLIFFDGSWDFVGDKSGLAVEIEDITGISEWVLSGSESVSSIPLAKRMSWAAARETTRVEDKAYCLLGIFEVNIPMIYGEGSKAFIRLQEEILSQTTDLSIFAWKASDSSKEHRGMLAESPVEFLHCKHIEPNDSQFCFRDEISLTNRGLKIRIPLTFDGNGTYIMDLHCYDEDAQSGASQRLGIYLQRALDTYYRYLPQNIARVGEVSSMRVSRPIFLASTADEETAQSLAREKRHRRVFFEFPKTTTNYESGDFRAVPDTYWDTYEQYFSIGALSRFTGFVRFSVTSRVQVQWDTITKQTTSFIIVCDLTSGPDFRISLYAQTGLQNSSKPAEFIDPFTDIDQYGPLGDPFSLTMLRPGEREDRSVSIIHRDRRHNYTVTASVITALSPSFAIKIEIYPSSLEDNVGRGTPFYDHQIYGVPEPLQKDDPGLHGRRRGDWSTN
jgi:hypothetical protein